MLTFWLIMGSITFVIEFCRKTYKCNTAFDNCWLIMGAFVIWPFPLLIFLSEFIPSIPRRFEMWNIRKDIRKDRINGKGFY